MIPTVTIKVNEWRLMGVYREWSLQGDPLTKSKELQSERFGDFIGKWKGINTKSVILGDFNFDPVSMSDYQKGLDCIRLQVNDDILPSGWRQLIRGMTRTEIREDRTQK